MHGPCEYLWARQSLRDMRVSYIIDQICVKFAMVSAVFWPGRCFFQHAIPYQSRRLRGAVLVRLPCMSVGVTIQWLSISTPTMSRSGISRVCRNCRLCGRKLLEYYICMYCNAPACLRQSSGTGYYGLLTDHGMDVSYQ